MNTIIPDELSFNLDLKDLPARATQLDSDALSLYSQGSCGDYYNPGMRVTGYPDQNNAAKVCPRVCGSVRRRFNGNFRALGRIDTGRVFNRYEYDIACRCCS